MALEALGQALSNIGENYLRATRADQARADEIAERRRMTEEERNFQREMYAKGQQDRRAAMREELAARTAAEIERARKLPYATLVGEAATLGAVDADKMSPAELQQFVATKQAERAIAADLAIKQGALENENKLKPVEYKSKFDENDSIYNATQSVNTALANSLTALAQADNGRKAMALASDYAAKLVNGKYGAMSGPARAAAYKELNLPENADPMAIAGSDPDLAGAMMTFSRDVLPNIARNDGVYQSLLAKVNFYSAESTKLNSQAFSRGVNPYLPKKDQSWFIGGAPSDYVDKSVPGSFFGAGRTEGPPPGVPASGGMADPNALDAAVNPGGQPGAAAAAPGAATPPPPVAAVPKFQYFSPAPDPQGTMANIRRNDAVADTFRSMRDSVGNVVNGTNLTTALPANVVSFLTPSNWQGSWDTNRLAYVPTGTVPMYLGTTPEQRMVDLNNRVGALSDPNSPRAMALREEMTRMASPAAYFNRPRGR